MLTFWAVVPPGFYCRPGWGAKPLAENVRPFELAAEAEAAGFRACLRCRPYRVAGPVAADAPEMVCCAVQLIITGVLDTGTETALGARLAVSPRHLRRLFHDHLGVTPDQLARSRRAPLPRPPLHEAHPTGAHPARAARVGDPRPVHPGTPLVFPAPPRQPPLRPPPVGRLLAVGLGLRVRAAWGVSEIAVEAALSQYSARPRVRKQLAALVEAAGRPVPGLDDGLTYLFPSAETLAGADLVAAGLPATTAQTLHELAVAVAEEETLPDGGARLAGIHAA